MENSTDVKVQSGVYTVELGRGKRVILWALVALVALALSLVYPALQFRGLERAEAMDMAQLARNIARGDGFTTRVIRPLSLWQLKEHSPSHEARLLEHPDLYNPPLYPLLLAGAFKALPDAAYKALFGFDAQKERAFGPERWIILPLNQLLLLLSLLVVYLWAKALFDTRVAVTAGLLLLASDTLWSYSIAGLPINLLMLLVLLCLGALWLVDRRLNPVSAEDQTAQPNRPDLTAVLLLLASALLAGLAFLTRYTAGLLVLPLMIYVARILRRRRGWLWALLYGAVFAAVALPWLVRNHQVSASFFGIAQYQIFGQDPLFRSYQPAPEDLFSFKVLLRELVVGTKTHFLGSLREIGSDFLVCFFLVGILYAFRRRDIARLRGVLIGLLAAAILAMAVFGAPGLGAGFDVAGGNLLVLFLPLVAVFGVAFFYLLLDRISFPNRLARGAAIALFGLVNVLPLIYTLLPPRRGPYPYPPYVAPFTAMVAEWFGPDEVGVSDLPWAMAWVGDRRTVWLPTQMRDLQDIHLFVAPQGLSFVMLTPNMLDRRLQTELIKGEFKDYASIVRGQLPVDFPLKAVTPLPPGNDQLLFADRHRWREPGAKFLKEPAEAKPGKKGETKPGQPAPAEPAEPKPAVSLN